MTEAPHIPPRAVPEPPVPPGVNPSKPGPARLYDYYLSGHNNFEVDRKAAEALRLSLPANATEQLILRPRAEVERFFAGLAMVPPYPGAIGGLTFVGQWGAVDPASTDSDGSRVLYCGVARCR